MNSGLGKIGRFMRRYYAPFLLKPLVKGFVLISFAGVFVASVISMQHIQLGLGECFWYYEVYPPLIFKI
jgi:Niemann-Pick C1 protein